MKKAKRSLRIFALLFVLVFSVSIAVGFAACGGSSGTVTGVNEENPGATDMMPSAKEHNKSAKSDSEFFYNMVESLFSYSYAATADNLKFSEPYYTPRYADRFTVNGTAYATYDENDGLLMYAPGIEINDKYYNSSYDEIFDVSFYGDGSDFYMTVGETDYSIYDNSVRYYDYEYYKMSYEYFLDYEFDRDLSEFLTDLDSQIVRSSIDVASSFLAEFLSDYFFEGVTMRDTSYGYELDVDFEKMKEANDVVYGMTLRSLIEDALDDDFDNILASLEKLFDEDVEDAVDALLKYGEDFGITKSLVDEIINMFTEYEDLDEFVEDFEGEGETVAEALGFNKYEVLRDIEFNVDMSLYSLLFYYYDDARESYEVMSENFNSAIYSDTSLAINTYPDGTLISIEFDSNGLTVGDGWDYSTISGHAIVYFDAVMPTIESNPAKTAVDEYIDEFEGWLKDAITDGGEYVFSSGSNYKYYATLENEEVIINYTYNGTTSSVSLADIDCLEFEDYYNYDYIYVWFNQYFENYDLWRSASLHMSR